MSEELLVFRGEVSAPERGELIVDSYVGLPHGTRLAISGGLRDATLRVTQLAAKPVLEATLVHALERELRLEADVASSLIAQLVGAGVLSHEVEAAARLTFSGHADIADALRATLTHAVWPTNLGNVEVAVLGALGSTRWYELLAQTQRRSSHVLTCSFEGTSAWVGPVLDSRAGSARAACPLCLQARRVASGADDHTPVVLTQPAHLAAVAGSLREVAELFARGELAAGRVLHVQGAVACWRTLLPQPHCTLCDVTSATPFRTLSTQRAEYAHWFERELARGEPHDEPSEHVRSTFLDPLLGPLRLETYEADGTFRDLPLVLGSIRTVTEAATHLSPLLFSSVLFGTGASERRRLLVAYAEGVERYAGVCDRPDLVAVPHSELSAHARLPEQTVRFSSEQYQRGEAVVHDRQALDWSWTYDWTAGDAKLLVHDFVAYGRTPGSAGVRLLDDPFSSGMSAHRSAALAIERSLLELIERDAFVLAWYLRLPLRQLDLGALSDPELRDMLTYLEAGGVVLKFYDLRVDFELPTVLAVAEATRTLGPWKRGGHILSACAGRTWRDAARHAVRELLGHYTVFALVSPNGDKSVDPATGCVRPWWPAFAALLEPRTDQPLGFLGQGAPHVVHDEESVEPRTLRNEFLQRGLSVYVRRLGGRDIEHSGLVAVRAIVPGLVRMTPTRGSVNFGETRFTSIAQRWGVEHTLNPLPHPLA